MYESYFGLREKPFSILPDPRFLYFSRNHQMAFSMLEYGIINQAGFTVVTGAIGSGKTTLIRQLLGCLGPDVRTGLISHTPRNNSPMLQWILMAFNQPFEEGSYAGLYKRYSEFVTSEYERHGRVVLIVDEAQNLDAERLEELRMLSNVNTDEMMMQLILVGQPELRATLQGPGMEQFAQRVSSDFNLPALQATEAMFYFDHRLRVAGCERELFSNEAKRMIHEDSKGVPRLMNVLADRCLVYAYAEEASMVTPRIVNQVIADRAQHGVFGSRVEAMPVAGTI
ncbi:general secretion pathway protein [Aureimonas altamirensis]|uniref:General secretion pathway protein n=1 Tax=Aureimonas altamirensis TaxID=370622 RepID=A0A0B1Q096_9HYPH|nr:AAA family ATPase [Aureimonas altamirensis]KHJ54173.1 general secretion pathway protein [Aureimonas altamirensis]